MHGFRKLAVLRAVILQDIVRQVGWTSTVGRLALDRQIAEHLKLKRSPKGIIIELTDHTTYYTRIGVEFSAVHQYHWPKEGTS